MSFSGGSTRSFGGKGVSQKKDRKKKQEFHKHKVKFTEEEHVDFDQLKARISLALDKLGHQTFSLEPGGYTFHNWMTSFNLLLDDFEEKAGPTNLPKDYYDARQKLTADLLKDADTSDVDAETRKLETEIESLSLNMSELTKKSNETLERKRQETASKIIDLKREEAESEDELEDAKEDLKNRSNKQQSFLGKLFSRSNNSSIESTQEKIDSLKARREGIKDNIQELESVSKSSVKDIDDEVMLLSTKLGTLQERLAETKLKKDERSQLVEKRIQTTTSLIQVISSLKLNDPVIE